MSYDPILIGLMLQAYHRNRVRFWSEVLSCLFWPPNLIRKIKRCKVEIDQRIKLEILLNQHRSYISFCRHVIKEQSEELQKDRLIKPDVPYRILDSQIRVHQHVSMFDEREVMLNGAANISHRMAVELESAIVLYCEEQGIRFEPPIESKPFLAMRYDPDKELKPMRKITQKVDKAGRFYYEDA